MAANVECSQFGTTRCSLFWRQSTWDSCRWAWFSLCLRCFVNRVRRSFWIQENSTKEFLYVPRGRTRGRNSICHHHVGACGSVISRHKGGNGKERKCAFRIFFDAMDIGMHGFLWGMFWIPLYLFEPCFTRLGHDKWIHFLCRSH